MALYLGDKQTKEGARPQGADEVGTGNGGSLWQRLAPHAITMVLLLLGVLLAAS